LAQRLHNDDHILDALQKLAPPHSAVAKCEMDPDLAALRLVERLLDFTCDEIRCRLDRIYLERLYEPLIHEDGFEEGLNIQEISLKSDLNSLQAEIRDVVAMSLSPLLKSLHEERQRQGASEDLENQSVSYVNPCSILRSDNYRCSRLSSNLGSYLKRLSIVSSHSTLIVHRSMPFTQLKKGLVLLFRQLQLMNACSFRLLKNYLLRKRHRELCSAMSGFRMGASMIVDHLSMTCQIK
jgi:hypothetical protein